MKTIILTFGITILFSCSLPDEGDQIGIVFTVSNNQPVAHDNAKITIGGLIDGQFIGTESYTFPKLGIRKYSDWYQ